jgi:hypothetical protein
MFFRTVLSANTLVRWVNENAFAPIVRARPCPTFGRPVHHRGGPRRLRPGTSPHTLRIPPHGGHPVLRSNAKSGFRFTLAVSSFRLRARLGFSIPSLFSGQRGVDPAFGYSAPHPSAGGTSTLLNNALLSAHYEPLRHPKRPSLTLTSCQLAFKHQPPMGLPVLRLVPSFVHAAANTPARSMEFNRSYPFHRHRPSPKSGRVGSCVVSFEAC